MRSVKKEYNEVLLTRRSAPFMYCVVFRRSDLITQKLESFKTGPDEPHPRVLKELANKFGPVFAHFFPTMNTGEIPRKRPLANICPLF